MLLKESPLQPAPETVFKSIFQMVKYHRARVPLAFEGMRNCRACCGDGKAARDSRVHLIEQGFSPTPIQMPASSPP